MTPTDRKLLSDLTSLLKASFPDQIMDIILFGSRVTGKANQDSDYDILIILKNKVDWQTERAISDVCYAIDLKYGVITDTHVLSEREIFSLRGKQPVFYNALAKGLHA